MKDDRLNKFIEIYQKYFQDELDRTEALKKAIKVLNLIEILYLPNFIIDHK